MNLLADLYCYGELEKIAASRLRSAVKLVELENKGGSKVYGLQMGDKVIGDMGIADGAVYHTQIDPKYKGLGLGKKLYGEVMRRQSGQALKSDEMVSPQVAAVWRRMQGTKGYSVVEHPHTFEEGDAFHETGGKGPVFEASLPSEAALATVGTRPAFLDSRPVTQRALQFLGRATDFQAGVIAGARHSVRVRNLRDRVRAWKEKSAGVDKRKEKLRAERARLTRLLENKQTLLRDGPGVHQTIVGLGAAGAGIGGAVGGPAGALAGGTAGILGGGVVKPALLRARIAQIDRELEKKGNVLPRPTITLPGTSKITELAGLDPDHLYAMYKAKQKGANSRVGTMARSFDAERAAIEKKAAAYSEGPTSTFSHEKRRYSVDKAIIATAEKPVRQVPVKDLAWILKYTKPDAGRTRAADTDVPVLATKYGDKLVVVDGLHRLAKAQAEGRETLPVRYVSRAALSKASIEKKAHITILTGSAGAGKSALAEKLRPQFDLVVGTDTGKAEGGKYVSPPAEEKVRIRAERTEQVLAAHREGKNVLLEGFPEGVLKHPGVLEQADKVLVLDTPALRALYDVGRRSFQRRTPVLADLKMAVETRRADPSLLEKIVNAVGPEKVQKIKRDFVGMAKKASPNTQKTSPVRLVDKPERWRAVLQSHPAIRAGQHYDLRLNDPSSGISHSWATKKDWPKPGERIRLFQQPDHKPSYSDFQGHLLQGRGKTKPGSKGVEKVMDERVEIKRTSDKLVRFDVFKKEGELPDRYVLVKAKHDGKGHPPWVLINHGKAKADQVPVK